MWLIKKEKIVSVGEMASCPSLSGGDRIFYCMRKQYVRAKGMPGGEYELGGQQVTVRDGKCVTSSNDLLAGLAYTRTNSTNIDEPGKPFRLIKSKSVYKCW